MEKMIGYCGIICSDCPVFITTLKDDDAERKRVAEKITKEWGEGKKKYKPEDVNCDGCMSNSQRLFRYCKDCRIRKCGRKKKVKNCAFCIEYPCKKLSRFLAGNPNARETLDGIRRELGIIRK